MSLEQKIDALTDAVAKLTDVMQNGTPISSHVEETAGGKSTGKSTSAELVWYHKPETKEVWQEPEQGRRKGITKVDETTAKRLQEQYAAEEAEQDQAADGSADDDLDMDFGEGDSNPLEDDEPMDDDEFAEKWKDWTQRAVKHAMGQGHDKTQAQTVVKKFIVPKVREYVGQNAEAKVGNVGADVRRKFLAEAEDFFN